MKKFTTFTFESFSFNEQKLEAHFYYSFDNGAEIFEEIIDFTCDGFELPQSKQAIGKETNGYGLGEDTILRNFLFQLHLALGISYYKLFPTSSLEVKSGYLDDDQIDFWERFYKNGLGEFFITNNIDPSELLNIQNAGQQLNIEELTIRNNYIENSVNFIEGKSLLLWGGGKDSIVSHSILKNNKKLDLFVFGKKDAIKDSTAKVSGEKLFLVKRTLSINLFKMNKQGYYNGHVPITGIIAFVTFVVSYLYGYSNIILSNEKSASEENTIWKGIKVNHQYSKSLQFEQDLEKYVQGYISQGIKYFSLLRGMYEYKIASIFSKQRQFFDKFSSCNRNFVITKDVQEKLWCCNCEKCCFVFLILSPFLDESELEKIFGENLFKNQALEKTFRELIGLEHHKPFECVGTYDECLLSAKKAIHKHGLNLPLVLKNIKKEVFDKCDAQLEKKLEKKLLEVSDEDIIPMNFKKYIL